MTTTFLTLEEVLALHADQLDRYGGKPGIRDVGLLQSALATPQAGFGGVLLHGTLAEQAAAYLFHLAQNQSFVDGNKRVGVAAAFMFAWLNGFELVVPPRELYDVTMAFATKKATKAEAAVLLARHLKKRR